jgi:hypothetical protein
MDLVQFKKDLDRDLKRRFGKNIETWVWPERCGVKGFYGNGQINNAVVIWITERPSLGKDKKATDKPSLWRQLLKSEGLENMHITDFVKIRAKPGKKPRKKELKASAEWMRKEIELLRRKNKKLIIIANARTVAKWMKEYLPTYQCEYIQFYQWCLTRGKGKIDLRKKLIELYETTTSNLGEDYTFIVSVSFDMQFTFRENEVQPAEEGGENDVEPTQ